MKAKEAENFNGEPNGRFYVIAVQGDCVTPSLPACFLSTDKPAASSSMHSSHDVPTIIGTKRQGQMTMDWILQSCELTPTFPFQVDDLRHVAIVTESWLVYHWETFPGFVVSLMYNLTVYTSFKRRDRSQWPLELGSLLMWASEWHRTWVVSVSHRAVGLLWSEMTQWENVCWSEPRRGDNMEGVADRRTGTSQVTRARWVSSVSPVGEWVGGRKSPQLQERHRSKLQVTRASVGLAEGRELS